MADDQPRSEQDVVEAFTRFQTLQNNAEAYEEYYKQITEQLDALNTTQDALDELKQSTEGKKMLVPLGSGAFAIATIESVDHVVVGLGADVFARQTVDNAQDTLQQRHADMEDAQEDVEQKIHETAEELSTLLPKLQQLQHQLTGGHG